jgi:hypothetical protein
MRILLPTCKTGIRSGQTFRAVIEDGSAPNGSGYPLDLRLGEAC